MKEESTLPILPFKDQERWWEWLSKHFHEPAGIWLRFYKKASTTPTVSYDQAVETALCFGWIDGQKKAYDSESYLLKFTPRRQRSIWSKINTERATRLIAEGKMQAPGLAQVEAAQADGRWDRAYDSQNTATVPADFQAELEKNKQANHFFQTISRANRYALLFRLHHITKPEQRQKKIMEFVAMLERGEVFH